MNFHENHEIHENLMLKTYEKRNDILHNADRIRKMPIELTKCQ